LKEKVETEGKKTPPDLIGGEKRRHERKTKDNKDFIRKGKWEGIHPIRKGSSRRHKRLFVLPKRQIESTTDSSILKKRQKFRQGGKKGDWSQISTILGRRKGDLVPF